MNYDMTKPRIPELEGKTFYDKDGVPLEGQRLQQNPYAEETLTMLIEVWYKNGKIHGKHGLSFPDGQREHWDNGKFIEVLSPPHCYAEYPYEENSLTEKRPTQQDIEDCIKYKNLPLTTFGRTWS